MSALSKKTPKPKKCRACRCEFEPRLAMQLVCGWQCAQALAVTLREKGRAAKAAKERKADAVKRQEQKSNGRLIAEAQAAFNSFIRARDADQPCICCGKPFEPQRPGGSVDAGHYRSRGSAPHLRFDEHNVHAQRKNCNRPGGTTHGQFQAGMLARIGWEALEALENDQEPRRFRREDLEAIKKTYRAKTREILKARA